MFSLCLNNLIEQYFISFLIIFIINILTVSNMYMYCLANSVIMGDSAAAASAAHSDDEEVTPGYIAPAKVCEPFIY